MQTDPVQVVMPARAASVTDGTVLEWRKAEGDSVEADEAIVEISTDKVDAEVPAPAAGRTFRSAAGPGEPLTVGTLLAELSTNGGGSDGLAPPGEQPVSAPVATRTEQPASSAA